MLTTHDFACDVCGSPAVMFPARLEEKESVLCARCRTPLGTLESFLRRLKRIVRSSDVAATDC